MDDFLNEVTGQNKVKEILQGILKTRRVPHAFLFYGPKGVGKFFTAIQFAKSLANKPELHGNETRLKKISQFHEPYVKLVLPLPRGKGESSDNTSFEKLTKNQIEILNEQIEQKINNPYHEIVIENANTIKINSIRDVKKFLDLSFDEILNRFVIISNAELMNEQAQNALLKSLEEPPEGIIFIIITSDREKLLTTIQSRCWPINFEPMDSICVTKVLTKYFKIDRVIAEKVSPFSNGSVVEAAILANKEFNELLESVISFLRYSIGKKILFGICGDNFTNRKLFGR